MTVVDGAHRLLAARIRGDRRIEAVFVDGDVTDVFVLAVELNSRHGLPLSRADRRAAALLILRCHPEWSDRRIAVAVGVSPKTVGAIRGRPTEEIPQLGLRVGLDGRARRPGSRSAGRSSGPESSTGSEDGGPSSDLQPAGVPPDLALHRHLNLNRKPEVSRILDKLRADPTLRGTDRGRTLLRVLLAQPLGMAGFRGLADAVPAYRRSLVAKLATECAGQWAALADELSDESATGGGPAAAGR